MWEGLICIFQPLILQATPEDVIAAQERVLEQLQVTHNQIVKFILDYRNNPYLKIFVKPFLEMTKAFHDFTRWLRVCSTLTLEQLGISCENFPTTFCTRLEEKLLKICQAITGHLPTLGYSQLFDMECMKSFIREAEETKLLPSDLESHYAQQIAQVIAQLELNDQLWERRSREEVITYIRRFVKAIEDYRLPETQKIVLRNASMELCLNALPENFTTQDFMNKAQEFKINPRTAQRYLSEFL